MWGDELGEMRDRIKLMRSALVNKIKECGATENFDFVLSQKGMFSYSGLSKEQVDVIREKDGIYAVSSGRICVAALNSGNIDAVAKAVASALKN